MVAPFYINEPADFLYPVGAELASGTVGTAYSTTISEYGGIGPFTFSITSGSLPAGLSLGSSTGVISGTPTTPGTYTFTLKVNDSAGHTGSKAFTIVVKSASTGGSYGWAY